MICENLGKVAPAVRAGASPARPSVRPFSVLGQDHLAHGCDARPHRRTYARCGTGQYPPRRTERAVRQSSGVSALARTFRRRTLIGPFHQRSPKSPASSGWTVATSPSITSPLAPSIVRMSPSLTSRPPHPEHAWPCTSIDERADARDARPPHAARDHRRMAGHAAACGEDALGGVHAVNILRARLRRAPGSPHHPRRRASRPRVRHRTPTMRRRPRRGEAGRPLAISIVAVRIGIERRDAAS